RSEETWLLNPGLSFPLDPHCATPRRLGAPSKEMRMSKEMVVSASAYDTKIAILEDGQVVEVYFEREREYSLAGSIYKGRVTRILPGMQSAFVNIGLERDAFLYVSDFLEGVEEYDRVST